MHIFCNSHHCSLPPMPLCECFCLLQLLIFSVFLIGILIFIYSSVVVFYIKFLHIAYPMFPSFGFSILPLFNFLIFHTNPSWFSVTVSYIHFKFSSLDSASLKEVVILLLKYRNFNFIMQKINITRNIFFFVVTGKPSFLEYFVSRTIYNYCYLIIFTGRHWTWLQMLYGFPTAVQFLFVLWVDFH